MSSFLDSQTFQTTRWKVFEINFVSVTTVISENNKEPEQDVALNVLDPFLPRFRSVTQSAGLWQTSEPNSCQVKAQNMSARIN